MKTENEMNNEPIKCAWQMRCSAWAHDGNAFSIEGEGPTLCINCWENEMMKRENQNIHCAFRNKDPEYEILEWPGNLEKTK